MYRIDYTKRFEKDLKRCLKRGLNILLIQEAISLLAEAGTLPTKYRPHKLSGQFDFIQLTNIKLCVISP